MIYSFKDKGLLELYEKGKTKRIDQLMHKRIIRRLDALGSATKPKDMNIPGFDYHGLKGHVPRRYSVHINGPWCITFEWNDGAENVNYEQYH